MIKKALMVLANNSADTAKLANWAGIKAYEWF